MPSTAIIYLLYSTPPNNLSLRTLPLPLSPTTSREAFLSALRTTTDLPLTDQNITLYWTLPHGAMRMAGGSSTTTTLLPTTIPITMPITVPYPTWHLSSQQLYTPWTAVYPFGSYYLGSTVHSSVVASPALSYGVGYATCRATASVPSTTYRSEPPRLDVSAMVKRVELMDVTEEQWPGYMSFAGDGLRLCVVVDVEGARAGRRVVVAQDDDASSSDPSGDRDPDIAAAGDDQA